MTFVTAYNPRTRRCAVGIVTTDGRCRIDVAAGESLSDFVLWETVWTDPKNPWAGGEITNRQVTHLRPDYT